MARFEQHRHEAVSRSQRLRLLIATALPMGALLWSAVHAQELQPVRAIEQLACGGSHTCVLDQGGQRLRCSGSNGSGQLGDGSLVSRPLPADVALAGQTVTAIAAGGSHTCAIVGGGALKCWGDNGNGQLGDGTNSDSAVPVNVQGLGSGVLAVAAGSFHSCAVTAAGAVQCWGFNNRGQLGDGSTTSSNVPVNVQGLNSGMAEVALGFRFSCARTTAGAVKCWGEGGSGELGDGMEANSSVPVDVQGLASGVSHIATGGFHGCALSGGALKCWGYNLFGQLGDGSNTSRSTPVDVQGLGAGVVALSAAVGTFNSDHTCAINSAGAVLCWGENRSGQLGDGGFVDRNTPAAVTGLNADMVGLCSGTDHSCARRSDGEVRCWGANGGGQLGDGTTTDRTLAVAMQEPGPARDVQRLTSGDLGSLAPAFDGPGRFVLFQSQATNLTGQPDGNAAIDVFRLDTQDGSIQRISLDNAGNEIAGNSIEPSLSADGQLAVFVAPAVGVAKLAGESKAAADGRRKGGGFRVLLRNMQTGTTRDVGAALPTGADTQPMIAPGGEAVVFTGLAGADEGQSGQVNVFRVPLQASGMERVPGTPKCLSCRSVGANGMDEAAPADGESRNARISADGRTVVWQTLARNSLSGSTSPCPTGRSEIVSRDFLTGQIQPLSRPSAGASDCGNQGARKPQIDWSGRRIVFESDQPLDAAGGGRDEVFVADVGPGGPQHRWMSARGDGSAGNAASHTPVLSGDGRSVVFISEASDIDLNFADNNGVADLHAKLIDRSGAAARLSLGRNGQQADQPGLRPALTYNGTRLAFDSTATNLTDAAASGVSEVFQRSVPANASLIYLAGFE